MEQCPKMSHTIVDEWRRCLLFSAKVDASPPFVKLASTSQLNKEPEDEHTESINNKRPCSREWAKTWRVKRVQGSKCRNLQPIDFEKVTSPCFLHQASSSQELRVRISNADPKVFANLNRHILENKDCWSA